MALRRISYVTVRDLAAIVPSAGIAHFLGSTQTFMMSRGTLRVLERNMIKFSVVITVKRR